MRSPGKFNHTRHMRHTRRKDLNGLHVLYGSKKLVDDEITRETLTIQGIEGIQGEKT